MPYKKTLPGFREKKFHFYTLNTLSQQKRNEKGGGGGDRERVNEEKLGKEVGVDDKFRSSEKEGTDLDERRGGRGKDSSDKKKKRRKDF